MPDPREEYCPHCKRTTTFDYSRHCGAWLCEVCDYHLGLCRCYCGWSESGGDGLAELEECGEQIDEA